MCGFNKYDHLFAAFLAAVTFGITPSQADFTLNFLPSDHINAGSQSSEQTYARCNVAGQPNAFCIHGGGGFAPDTTPFLRKFVTIDGIQYVHMMVGELSPITGRWRCCGLSQYHLTKSRNIRH